LETITLRQQVARAAQFIGAKIAQKPTIAIILGSGLGALADAVAEATILPYADVPYFPPTSVEGHRGRLVVGQLEGKTVAVLQGRAHGYEGHTLAQITLPIRVMHALGVETLIVTNAAGGLNPGFQAGDLMLITDQINLPGMVGHNPLYGLNDPALGPRFPGMNDAYDPALRALTRRVAEGQGLRLRQGVYVMLGGPSYETPAEVAFLRLIGGDAVGMSTASEVAVARHVGLRVLGFSLISNVLSHQPGQASPTHEEVLAATAAAMPRFIALIRGIVKAM
jgi:purine-nucleoside phosphorylase